MCRSWIVVPALASALAGLGQWDGSPSPVALDTVLWATGGLGQTVDIVQCGDGRLFLVRRMGNIRIVTDSATVLPTPFLDIESIVQDNGIEQGLLGMAFDPDYASNGYFYVHYIGFPNVSVVARYKVSSDPNFSSPTTAHIIWSYPQPDTNHNGGDLEFGPDGYLYITLGDGGGNGDPDDRGQDLTEPLGGILRIRPEPDSTYSIPADNPYANTGNDTLPEIWASGLRNPWRMGFDRLTGDVWIGDVGQALWEEVDFWPAGDNSGPNFGWRCREGFAPYNTTDCHPASYYDAPLVVHPNMPWCSIIGGRVYRGPDFPRLYGRYIYTDYCLGEFRSLRPDGLGGWTDEALLATGYSGFTCIGEDSAGTLYAADKDLTGRLYQLRDRCPMAAPTIVQNGSTLESSEAIEWQWYLDGAMIPGATTQTIEPSVSGAYQVVAHFDSACALASDTLFFIATGIDRHMIATMELSPVPARDLLRIRWSDPGARDLVIMDPLGREVEHVNAHGLAEWIFDTSHLAGGAYAIQLFGPRGNVIAARHALIAR